ncbi:MAG: hypothetical protein ACRDD7_00540 [Peptostreptococcaceae bacterium]
MNKKRGLWLVLGLILLCLVGVLYSCSDAIITDPVEIIKTNWDIDLPKNSKEIFHESSGGSFLGDGEKYSVYECEDEKSISVSFDWKYDEDKDVVDGFEDVIHKIKSYENTEIPDEFIPDLDKDFVYYYKKLDDNSKIYIILIDGDNKLYISEDIF